MSNLLSFALMRLVSGLRKSIAVFYHLEEAFTINVYVNRAFRLTLQTILINALCNEGKIVKITSIVLRIGIGQIIGLFLCTPAKVMFASCCGDIIFCFFNCLDINNLSILIAVALSKIGVSTKVGHSVLTLMPNSSAS